MGTLTYVGVGVRPSAVPPRRRRLRRLRSSQSRCADRGSASAELAVSLIGLVAALMPLLAGLQLVAWQARAQETARAVARELARGETPASAVDRGRSVFPQAETAVTAQGGDAIVHVAVPVRMAFGPTFTVRAKAIAVPEQP